MTALPALLNPILTLLGLGLGIGSVLGFIAKRFQLESDPIVNRINNLLPQTQCGHCGYPGCKPYAQAIAEGEAINKCPPGGAGTIRKLANLLNLEELPLDATYGVEEVPKVARIREAECIGCALCIPACPVDAILGAPKFMHTVIESECTGCDLCVEPCPVDCIDMIEPHTQAIAAKQQDHLPCINCGLCIDECPVEILPHTLYRACDDENLELAKSLKLEYCIECRKCDNVCPSGIPLVGYYQAAKEKLQLETVEKIKANNAKKRFECHLERQERIKVEEEVLREKRAKLAQQNKSKTSNQNIQAALERVRARKNEKPSP